MRRGTVVKAQAFFGLAEIAADHIGEFFQLDLNSRIKGVQIVHRQQPRRFVILMLFGVLMRTANVFARIEIAAEHAHV